MNVFFDSRFAAAYAAHPLVLVDVGARGGLKKNWMAAADHLLVLGFEPDSVEYARLAASMPSDGSRRFFDVALADRAGIVRLHITRDAGLSSIHAPNRPFLDAFPDADRFDIDRMADVRVDTLDSVLRAGQVADVDFLKADTQGSELLVLQGAAATLASATFGLEIEVEFAPIYEGQPFFADVDRYVRPMGYELFDLRPVYWKRAAGRALGGPRGQIAWADALYFRTIPSLRAVTAGLPADLRRSKWLRAMSISLLYGYADYTVELARSAGDALGPGEAAAVEQAVHREAGSRRLNGFPGRRILAQVFGRLGRWAQPRDDSWSISRGVIGNVE